MEFIEYRGFKNRFIGLAQEKNKYYIIYGHTGMPNLTYDTECSDIKFYYNLTTNFITNMDAKINIPFICRDKNNTLFYCISIQNKESYNEILSVVENLL